MKKIITTALLLAFIVAGMSFSFRQAERTYSMNSYEKVYKTEIKELTPEEKLNAFEYFSATSDCSFKGIELKGKVKFVTSFPDIKIQYVTSFPDIKVKHVTSFPDDCGEWQIVESFPDFEVQVVTSFPDLKVQLVESFPGMN
ncbi:hypothetical protein [Parvicella tangerina]|uniref:7(1) septoil knot domain-containing protein n=1 Tax=Parvicella tangerina TaxID=2829795 RepID=A0A916JLQ8_9FLAO|nr:hypothetical protein [Parvicella tangerina]CAG5079397.1 hypothetical protein CRYO30217_00934 [Parvicella tangerina]